MSRSACGYTRSINFFGRLSPRDLLRVYGSPLYVYNEKILRERCRDLKKLSANPAFEVNYSVKANSNPALLRVVKEEGLRVDAMSLGELAMDRLAGFDPKNVLFISNNNTREELCQAVAAGCLVSVDSLSQLASLGEIAPGAKTMCRINPGIGAGHSAKVITGGANTKFGIDADRMGEIIELARRYDLRLAGLNQHIGSLFMSPEKYLAASSFLLEYARALPPDRFEQLEILDFGGGFGIPYHKYDGEKRLDLGALAEGLNALMSDFQAKTSYRGKFLIEPGRYVMAECGTLLGQIVAIKDNGDARYVGTDIGFNVLQRPVMYDAWHDIEVYAPDDRDLLCQTVVGNICESGDILAKNRPLPEMREGDVIGLLDAGAYGFSMASNYNDRFLPAEVLITEDGCCNLIRRRQRAEDLAACLLP
ncbi:MAG: diaminopimelate decarboxylase [Desulfovibrio sp.]|nr:diaminopimelate decarboxylase [Desulfovibrio sp.]